MIIIKKLVLGVSIIILFLVVGYASVSTNLVTSGLAQIGSLNSNNFSVQFSSAQCVDGSCPIEPNNKHSISYTTGQLSTVGDTAVINYVVKNDSTQYDADVGITFTIPSSYDSIINVDKVGFTDNQVYRIEGQKSKSGSLTITLTGTPTEPITLNITLELNITAVSRTSTAINLDIVDPSNDIHFGNNTIDSEFQQSGNAKLDLGEATNLRLKKIAALANGVSESVVNNYTVYNTTDTYIQAIVWSSTPPTQQQKVEYGQLAMTDDSPLGLDADGTTNELIVSDVPIYAWYDSGTIYIWSSDDSIDMHPHSERMFEGMTNLTNISALSHFVSSDVTTMRYMFKNTSVSSFSSLSSWDYVRVKASFNPANQALPENNGFYQICNNIPNNRHMEITSPSGTWNNEGTFLPRDYRYYADIDSDGVITQADYAAVDNYLSGVSTSINCSYNDTICGDVDGDSMVSRADAILISTLIDN